MNKGFTLVELLVVLAISTFLIGMALVGTQGTQAQVTLNSAATDFISNINLMKNNAIAGDVNLGEETVDLNYNWVYGFSIFPGPLSSTPTSNPALCQSTLSTECSGGYYTAIIIKSIHYPGASGGSIPVCSDTTRITSTDQNSFPPIGNSLNYVNNLNSCANPQLTFGSGSPILSFSPSQTSTLRSGFWLYYNSLPIGVSISYPNSLPSNDEYFPVFQELTGYIYLYNLNTGQLETSPSNKSLSTVFNLSYEGYTIPITFYDLYNSSSDSNTFSEGNIING